MADVRRFTRELIRLRRRLVPLFNEGAGVGLVDILRDAAIEWSGVHVGQPDTSDGSRSIALTSGRPAGSIHLVFNAYWEPLEFELPGTGIDGIGWTRIIDTSLPSPADIEVDRGGTPVPGRRPTCDRALDRRGGGVSWPDRQPVDHWSATRLLERSPSSRSSTTPRTRTTPPAVSTSRESASRDVRESARSASRTRALTSSSSGSSPEWWSASNGSSIAVVPKPAATVIAVASIRVRDDRRVHWRDPGLALLGGDRARGLAAPQLGRGA